MSKAKTVTKVLKTAYKRIEKGWTTGTWHRRDDDGNNFVCLEGAIFGFCTEPQTQQQRDALTTRSVKTPRTPFVASAVVAREKDDGVVEFAIRFKVGEQSTHARVDVLDHCREDRHAVR